MVPAHQLASSPTALCPLLHHTSHHHTHNVELWPVYTSQFMQGIRKYYIALEMWPKS